MLITTRASVDHRYGTHFLPLEIIHHVRTTFRVLRRLAAHDDDIKIAAEHTNRVHGRFAFDFGRGLGISDFVARDAKNLACCGEGEKRARRRLRKKEHGPFVWQQLAQPITGLAISRHRTDDIRDDAKLLEKRRSQLGSKNHVLQSTLVLQFTYFLLQRSVELRLKVCEFALVDRRIVHDCLEGSRSKSA